MPKERCSKGKSPLIHRTRTSTGIPRTIVGVLSVCVSSKRARSTWRSSRSESPLRIKIQSCGRRAAFLASSDASKIRASYLEPVRAAHAVCTSPLTLSRWRGGVLERRT